VSGVVGRYLPRKPVTVRHDEYMVSNFYTWYRTVLQKIIRLNPTGPQEMELFSLYRKLKGEEEVYVNLSKEISLTRIDGEVISLLHKMAKTYVELAVPILKEVARMAPAVQKAVFTTYVRGHASFNFIMGNVMGTVISIPFRHLLAELETIATSFAMLVGAREALFAEEVVGRGEYGAEVPGEGEEEEA